MGLQQDGPILVTECPGDAIAAWTTGIPVIAITGAARTRQATDLIRQWCSDRRFIAAGDADEAGAKFVQALVKQLGASILSLPDDIKDISDWMKKAKSHLQVSCAKRLTRRPCRTMRTIRTSRP
jgi:hypothetical protein